MLKIGLTFMVEAAVIVSAATTKHTHNNNTCRTQNTDHKSMTNAFS